jgi:polysaccharide biosynthesis/export protein
VTVGLTAGVVAAALLLPVGAVRGEYRLQAGDVVEITVAGVQELRHRVPVQLDGSIAVPLGGTLMVEGVPFSEVRGKIQSLVASRVFRLRTLDGREVSRMFDRDEVAASIVEYKPVFVTGDVTRISELPFKPRMTARQALASAGGLITQSRGNVTAADIPSLRSEYVNVWLGLAKEHARLWRIRTEMGEEVDYDSKALPPPPVSDALAGQIVNLEVEYRTLQRSDHQRARDHILRSMRLAEEQMKVLAEQQEKEEQGTLADTQELTRSTELLGRGMLANQRVTDARRAVLLSSTRQLQTAARLMDVKKSHSDFARELEKLEDQRRIRLLSEWQDATVKVAGERAKLQSAEERLTLAGVRPPRAAENSNVFEVTLIRKGASGRERLAADLDTELQPGDVVEFTLRDGSIEIAGR